MMHIPFIIVLSEHFAYLALHFQSLIWEKRCQKEGFVPPGREVYVEEGDEMKKKESPSKWGRLDMYASCLFSLSN